MRSAGRPPSVPPARNPLISLTVACSQQLWPDSCGVSGRQAGGLPRGLRQTMQCSGRNTLKTTAYRPGFATAPVSQKALVSPPLAPYTGQRRRGRVVEGTPLLRVQTGNRLEGSNPFVSATCPRESVLPIRLRPDFSVVFGGYVGVALHWRPHYSDRTRSLAPDIL